MSVDYQGCMYYKCTDISYSDFILSFRGRTGNEIKKEIVRSGERNRVIEK